MLRRSRGVRGARSVVRLAAHVGLFVGLLAALLAPARTTPALGQGAVFPQGVAAGDVTDDTAVIWTRAPESPEVRVSYATDPGFVSAQHAGPFRPLAEHDFTVKADLRSLRAGQRYHYRVAAGSTLGPSGSFMTAPPPDRDARLDPPLSLVWGADTYEGNRPFRIFSAMRSRAADVFLYLGDTIYADLGARATTLEQYREKYRLYREDADLRAYLSTTASWVVWDDHEVANNFGSGHPRLAIGLQALFEYWPIRPSADEPGRLYRRMRWGRAAEIFILDTRQYRTPSAQPDTGAKSMLGAAQKAWLLDGLARSDAAVKIVASSVMLRHSGADSWVGYARERDEILGVIRDRRISNVFFLTADVHYAALVRHPEGVHEAVAGPLAAFTGTARAAGRPGTIWAQAGKLNYGWLRIVDGTVIIGWADDANAPLFETRVPITR